MEVEEVEVEKVVRVRKCPWRRPVVFRVKEINGRWVHLAKQSWVLVVICHSYAYMYIVNIKKKYSTLHMI